MRAILNTIFRRLVVTGTLIVRWPDGVSTRYGGGHGPEASIAIHDNATVRRLVLNPTLAFGEAYMDGGLTPDGCSIAEVLDVLTTNLWSERPLPPILRLRDAFNWLQRRFDQYNPAARSQRNVAHHYDLNGRLYSLFLDRDRQYSCAYFPNGDETLEEAQLAKKRHIAAKLRLDRPGLRLLDIGCGWGGMALTLARDYDADVTGITLSAEQLAEARARARAEGLGDKVRFELLDYRALDRPFDRIVSVGMFEHVGVGHYREFFDTVKRCLTPDGIALLHSIGRSQPPGSTNPWIALPVTALRAPPTPVVQLTFGTPSLDRAAVQGKPKGWDHTFSLLQPWPGSGAPGRQCGMVQCARSSAKAAQHDALQGLVCSEKVLHRGNRDVRRPLGGETIDAGRDGREGDGGEALPAGQRQARSVGAGQE